MPEKIITFWAERYFNTKYYINLIQELIEDSPRSPVKSRGHPKLPNMSDWKCQKRIKSLEKPNKDKV